MILDTSISRLKTNASLSKSFSKSSFKFAVLASAALADPVTVVDIVAVGDKPHLFARVQEGGGGDFY